MAEHDLVLTRYAELDARLVDVARGIRVLSQLGWSANVSAEFLQDYARGQPKLPKIEHQVVDHKEKRQELLKIVKDCDQHHPIGRYIAQTASSYIIAARMLEKVGGYEFMQMSEILYGNPTDRLGSLSNLDLAEDFIKITTDFGAEDSGTEKTWDAVRSPDVVVTELQKHATEFFGPDLIRVEIDPQLASKAAAGSERLRIRGGTGFRQAEVDQLVQHELFVHSASMLNGRRQPNLKSLGLGAPRTTGTQEGLATFAEMITDTMDLSRLRRIALRIKAIHLAMEGSDFIEVFRFFLSSGQSQIESFQSAARVFRGGDVRGRYVFTKDVVYLKGLVSVHTFMRKAIEMRKIEYPKMLFVGRTALGDVISLEPFVNSGFIAQPQYLPKWVEKRNSLAAYLCYSVFTNRLDLSAVHLVDFIDSSLTEDLEGLDLDSMA